MSAWDTRALRVAASTALAVVSVAACTASTEEAPVTGAATPENETIHVEPTPRPGDPGPGPGVASDSGAPAADAGVDAGPPAVTAAALLAKAQGCAKKVSSAPYAKDSGGTANIDVCALVGAVFWTADMDIDCDGKETPQCNLQTDPAYQNQTSAEDSQGQPLDAASLPYVVVPLPSNRFDYAAAGLELGTVIAVIYQGQVRYGVFGDEGPDNIIGEASYAMAQSLGVDPDPSTGGTDGPVTYIAFVGESGVVGTIEDHDEAVSVGEARAAQLLAEN